MENEKSIGIIVTYPEIGRKHVDFSGIAGYTKNLLFGLTGEQRKKIVIFSDIKDGAKIFTEEGIEVNECWQRNKLSFVGQIIKSIKNYPTLEIVHVQHEFNLFGGSLSILLYLLLLKRIKKLNKKIVATYHGVISPKIIDKKFKEVNQLNIPVPLIKFFFGFIYKLSARYIDKAIVHENYFKKVLVNDYGFADNQVDVIHHGIEERSLTLFQKEAREKLKISQDKKVILFFGFLAGYKGVDLLLDTFQLLDENQYFLILAGGKPKRVEKDRSYNAWFEGLESRIKGSQNILQTGFVPDDQIDLYFSASDVLVLPYLQMLSASGPMSFALSFGKPFLASDVFREVLENDKLIFQRNKESLKRSIELFFGNQSDFNDYIKERKAERSWDRIGQQTFTLYSHVAHLSA